MKTFRDTPMTVTAVAQLLDVSPSTLRSWDRRYGLGPGDRQSGARRRYTETDISRLRGMIELTKNGTPAMEAAQIVSAPTWGQVVIPVAAAGVGVEQLIDLAKRSDPQIYDCVEAVLSADNLIDAWVDLIDPALLKLRHETEGNGPGDSPVLVIYNAVLKALNSLNAQISEEDLSHNVKITILLQNEVSLLGNIVGTSLYAHGFPTKILPLWSASSAGAFERFLMHMQTFRSQIVIILGYLDSQQEFLEKVLLDTSVSLIVVAESLPSLVHPRLQRVRTLSAAVDEAASLAVSLETDGHSDHGSFTI